MLPMPWVVAVIKRIGCKWITQADDKVWLLSTVPTEYDYELHMY